MRNQIFKTFLLTLLVAAALIGLFYAPRIEVAGTMLRRVNLLADVQRRDAAGRVVAEVQADSAEGIVQAELDAAAVQVAEMNYTDSVPEGMTAIEDFADADGLVREMDRFYAALDEAGRRPVRIAYFGDSFIEGDILTADLRHHLQQRYGGQGVGWVDITSVTEGFRQTVLHTNRGWDEHSANDRRGKAFRTEWQGLAGHYYLPTGQASVSLIGQRRVYGEQLDTAEVATIFFSPGSSLQLTASINGGEPQTLHDGAGEAESAELASAAYDTLAAVAEQDDSAAVVRRQEAERQTAGTAVAGTIEAASLGGRIGRIDVKASGAGRFYGISLDGRRGISLDNFSMRGSNGWFIREIPESTLLRFAQLRPYDLIIVHYGLNVASKGTTDYQYYIRRMSVSLDHLRRCFPQASILVLSVSDRDQRGTDGAMHTMEGVQELVQYQRRMASDSHIAFWNLYEAMGGDGSIARMKEEGKANLDFTHINFAGGRHLGRMLFDVLMNGKENYDRRSRYQGNPK